MYSIGCELPCCTSLIIYAKYVIQYGTYQCPNPVNIREYGYNWHVCPNILIFSIIEPSGPVEQGPDVKMNTETGEPVYRDLFTEYMNVSVEECYWYNTYPDCDAAPWFQESNRLTHALLVAHNTATLAPKVSAQYQGGALYFKIIMMDLIVEQDAKLAVKYLAVVENTKIRDIPGENVNQAVSTLRACVSGLYNLKHLPVNIVILLLKVFTTTSVEHFNEMHFSGCERLSTCSTMANKPRVYSQSRLYLVVRRLKNR